MHIFTVDLIFNSLGLQIQNSAGNAGVKMFYPTSAALHKMRTPYYLIHTFIKQSAYWFLALEVKWFLAAAIV